MGGTAYNEASFYHSQQADDTGAKIKMRDQRPKNKEPRKAKTRNEPSGFYGSKGHMAVKKTLYTRRLPQTEADWWDDTTQPTHAGHIAVSLKLEDEIPFCDICYEPTMQAFEPPVGTREVQLMDLVRTNHRRSMSFCLRVADPRC